MRPLVAAVVLAIALAGCSAEGDAPVSDEEDFSELGLEATEQTGVIRGVVVDAAIAPIAGATIDLVGQGQNATTGDDGLFGFDGLEPGTYFLEVRRLGYGGIQQSVDVEAGVAEPRVVRVQLVADPSTAPYVEQHTYQGFISCSFKVANIVFDAFYCDPTGAAGLAANDDANPFFATRPGRAPDYFQSEILWDSTQPLWDELVTIQLACEEEGCGETSEDGNANRMCNVRGMSPLVCRVNATDGGGGGGVGITENKLGTNRTGYTVGVYANCDPCVPGTVLGFGLVYQQQFEIFSHLFYGYLPPEGWIFVEDSYVPEPPA